MPRSLDHIVWPTRNLDALADSFRRLGFTVGRRNRHPWATVNHIVQFDGAFLELLGFADDYRPVGPDDPSFPFAGFCHRALQRMDAGAAMLVLRSDDASADAVRLQRERLGHGRMLPFSRAAEGPDGSDRTVAFTIAFADLSGLPELGTFLCEQHRPENFWDPAMQRHANGAVGIAGLTIASRMPDADAAALSRFADAGSEPLTAEVRLGDGAKIGLDPDAAEALPPITRVDFRVADLSAVETTLRAAGVEAQADGHALTAQVHPLGGTTLVFREEPAPRGSPTYPAARTSEAM